mmetsp:Transcript_12865/g.31244  ORF Transcript_12865/g.31244 Transcript_12865/m.31244 type:complete len:260 (+) Transcript_12865:334-1113(+)
MFRRLITLILFFLDSCNTRFFLRFCHSLFVLFLLFLVTVVFLLFFLLDNRRSQRSARGGGRGGGDRDQPWTSRGLLWDDDIQNTINETDFDLVLVGCVLIKFEPTVDDVRIAQFVGTLSIDRHDMVIIDRNLQIFHVVSCHVDGNRRNFVCLVMMNGTTFRNHMGAILVLIGVGGSRLRCRSSCRFLVAITSCNCLIVFADACLLCVTTIRFLVLARSLCSCRCCCCHRCRRNEESSRTATLVWCKGGRMVGWCNNEHG